MSFQDVGNCVLNFNQAGDANYAAASQVQQTFAVGKGSQTVAFTSSAPGSATNGGATYAVTATATSSLSVAITVDAASAAVCSISGGTVSFLGAGSCVLNADQIGTDLWNPAPRVQQAFAVAASTQTVSITSSAPTTLKVGQTPGYVPVGTASSSLPVSFSIDGSTSSTCTLVSGEVRCIAAGSCQVVGSQGGNTNFLAATPQSQPFTCQKGDQTISFASTPSPLLKGDVYAAAVTSTSGLAVTLTVAAGSSSVCNISSSGMVLGLDAGSCVLNANVASTANYNAATLVTDRKSVV